MEASASRVIVINGIEQYGNEMLIVLASVLTLIVAFFIFRVGISWLKRSDGYGDSEAEYKRWMRESGNS